MAANHIIIIDRMENGIKESGIGYNLRLTPVLHRVAVKLCFCNLAKFSQFLISCFAKFSSNFAKIKIICQNFVFREILTK